MDLGKRLLQRNRLEWRHFTGNEVLGRFCFVFEFDVRQLNPQIPTHLKESVLDLHVEELVLSDVLRHRLRHVLPAAEGVGEAAVDRLRREGQAVAALLQGMLHG